MSNIYTISSGLPFAKSLANRLLEEYRDAPEALSRTRIFLPTRRACRTLADAFLKLSGGQALILPKMQAFGNVDEEELSLSILGEDETSELLNIPPAITPMRRQILLARAVHAAGGYEQSFDHAMALAAALGQLMDHIHTEDLSLDHLEGLVPDNLSAHWQKTLKFLDILRETWPGILEERGVIDIADRRNRLIKALTAHWTKHPPKGRVIAAGSTGSIPSTAEFLKLVSKLENGSVILPGLDQNMDENSWSSMNETHPQYGLRELLTRIGIDRHDVQPWENVPIEKQDKLLLATEIMRPPETTSDWSESLSGAHTEHIKSALKDIALVECRTVQEEAKAIGIAIRETLETTNDTVTLITPDRNLAARVKAVCKRWDITLDDSAGMPLSQTHLGVFLMSVLHNTASNFSPVHLASLCKDTFFHLGLDAQERRSAISNLERYALRGLKPENGLKSIRSRLEREKKDTENAEQLLQKIDEAFAALINVRTSKNSFPEFLKHHIDVAELLALHHNPEQQKSLWAGHTGQEAAKMIAQMMDETGDMPHLEFDDYINIFSYFMNMQLVRPPYGTHPRVHILGQLEARLIDSDIIILASLNEGKWPREPAHDPWMSRAMQKSFGLPSPERSIGLSAHDFVQGFCAQKAILTRAVYDENAPTIPSRWLQRLDMILQSCDIPKTEITNQHYTHWAREIDQPQEFAPCERPAPTPETPLRPRELSATRIETWMKDPYSIYARYILDLKPLKPLENPIDSAERGTFFHRVLQKFVQQNMGSIGANAAQEILETAQNVLADEYENPAEWADYWPRLTRMFEEFIKLEQDWRVPARPLQVESSGTITIQTNAAPFHLSAKADRIDLDTAGLAVIDYKTSSNMAKNAITNGQKPQLALEGLIAAKGGFENTAGHKLGSLQYWAISGGQDKTKRIIVDQNLDQVVQETLEGLTHLINVFDNKDIAYLSVPDAQNQPAFNDYEHLSRIREWSVLNTESEAA